MFQRFATAVEKEYLQQPQLCCPNWFQGLGFRVLRDLACAPTMFRSPLHPKLISVLD